MTRPTHLQRSDGSWVITADVPGLPVRMGQRVQVTCEQSETFDRRYLGLVGVVTALVYDDPRVQYPADPLLRVDVSGLGWDLFFPAEVGFTQWPRSLPEPP